MQTTSKESHNFCSPIGPVFGSIQDLCSAYAATSGCGILQMLAPLQSAKNGASRIPILENSNGEIIRNR